MKFVSVLIACLAYTANLALAEEVKECEGGSLGDDRRRPSTVILNLLFALLLRLLVVCVKVMDDIRASMNKEDSRKKPLIEKAIGDYCKNHGESLSAREKKICYYIDPIKRDVAQPFSLGMPSLKVCKRITKNNPEICTVKFPVKTEKMEKKDISKLRVKQLKSILSERGVECKGCIEKEEFIKRVQETEHLAGDEF
eukprot:scaffold22568_cov125-Cylindrotheca_fusiformis.AAC.9